jgi:hypothetical protein
VEQKKRIKLAVIILAVLLGLSLIALGGTLIYRNLVSREPASVTVSDNLITPEEETGEKDEKDKKEDTASDEADQSDSQTGSDASNENDASNSTSNGDGTSQTDKQTASQGTSSGTTGTAQASSGEKKQAATIALYNKQLEDNTPFQVSNMFPGDSETKYFRVQVSYKNQVTVHFKVAVREGYEKLAEVLKVRVRLLTTGETLYDGLMKDMPESVTHQLSSAKSTTDELYYEITAYLDTSVGNDYQNKDLIADFHWWVEETENLAPAPKTGDQSRIFLFASVAVVCAGVMIFLLLIRRRKEEEHHV